MNPVVEVLRVGTFKDSSDTEHTFTEADLNKIASSYDPTRYEAPVVIGHPSDSAPAYGWIKSAFVKGKSLFLELKNLVPEFVDVCRKGMYKKRSISLYPDRTIRHLGFLGAMPPAIKGLADCSFSEGKAVFIDFMESENVSTEIDIREAEHASFCDTLIAEGRISPGMKNMIMNQLETAYQISSVSFAENQETPLDALKRTLRGNSIKADSLPETAGERLNSLVKKKMNDNNGMSFSEAFSAVQLENIELANEYAREIRY